MMLAASSLEAALGATPTLTHYLAVSGLLFAVGLAGVLLRRNIIAAMTLGRALQWVVHDARGGCAERTVRGDR